jgi:N-acetylmuramic acid 6-phosphate etherase
MRITEHPSEHRHLEQLPVRELLERMNAEDQTVPAAVSRALPQIEALVETAVDHLLAGGRLFYLGAGTSGRLGVVDASECPPTFGVPQGLVVGLIAGGDSAIRKAVEFAEDDLEAGWRDLQLHEVSPADFVVGIAASGGTPYVVGALKQCRTAGIKTGCVVCNPASAVAAAADYPVEVVVGPEFVTGSTRLKAGTAQKLVLNMISTASMIRLGRVQDNRMVDMQLSNEKLVDRGTRMVMEGTGLPHDSAKALLLKTGSVRDALRNFREAE